MIEPFEPTLIRELNGEKIVSYGTSSYGYDIRCANEFKVFTNINSTIVDPKNFDPNSFVEFNNDFCIIPPNSFALARTVEYFRIPRSVLTVCWVNRRMRVAASSSMSRRLNLSGKVMSRWNSATPPRYPPRFMRVKAAPRCCSLSLMRNAKLPTRTEVASTRAR